MIQLFVVFTYLLWIPSLIGWGTILDFLSRFKRLNLNYSFPNEIKITIYGLLGFVIIATIGTIANFFIPLSSSASFSLLLLGLVLFVIKKKKFLARLSGNDVAIIIGLVIYCSVFVLINCRVHDTGLYHLPYIKWVGESKLPYGLANLNSRFGFNSSWFIVAAILEPARFIARGPFFILNGILLFFCGLPIFLLLKDWSTENKHIPGKNIELSSLFLILSAIPWLSQLHFFLSSPSPDVPAMFIGMLITYLLIYEFEHRRNSNEILLILIILSTFILMIKLSVAVYFVCVYFILFILLFDKKKRSDKALPRYFIKLDAPFFIVTLIISLILIIPYIIRSIIISGCVFYPLKIGFFAKLKWAVPISQVMEESGWIRSWARAPYLPSKEVLSNWQWLQPWLKDFALKEFLIIGMFLIGAVLFFFSIFRSKNKNIEKYFFVPFVISSLGIIYWFFTAPSPRFGYGYLYSFSILSFSFGIIRSKLLIQMRDWLRKTRNYEIICIIVGCGLIVSGISVLFAGSSEKILNLIAMKIIKKEIDFVFWRPTFRLLGFCVFAGGSLIIAMISLKRSKGLPLKQAKIRALSISFLLLLLGLNYVQMYFKDIVNISKVPQISIVPETNRDGVTIYKPKDPSEQRCFDAPIPCSYKYDINMRVTLSKDHKPIMFWNPER